MAGKTRGRSRDGRTKPSVVRWVIWAVLLACGPRWGEAAAGAPDDAAAAARSGLAHFLARAAADGPGRYGFAPGENLDLARPGPPFQLHAITPSALAGYRKGDGVSSIMAPTETWLVPVVLDRRIRAILTVEGPGGGWRAVALGKAPLAAELEKVLERWPKRAGYELRLVAVFPANAYFFTVPELGDRNLSPFVFSGKSFGTAPRPGEADYAAPLDFDTVAEEIKAVVYEKLAIPAGGGEGGGR